MADKIERKLIEYGLSDREAQIYLASMEIGATTVQNIAKKAGVNRVSAYPVIESLMDKGLMSTYEEGKKTYYVASEPEGLLNFLEQKKRIIETQKEEVEKLLPELKSKYNVEKGKPKVRYYEGLDGVVAMNEETLPQQSGDIYTVFNRDLVLKNIPEGVIKSIRERRHNREVKAYAIYQSSLDVGSDSFAERYLINDSDLPITADIGIYKNKVRFISFANGVSGIIIEDDQIAETLRSVFKLAIRCADNSEKKERSGD